MEVIKGKIQTLGDSRVTGKFRVFRSMRFITTEGKEAYFENVKVLPKLESVCEVGATGVFILRQFSIAGGLHLQAANTNLGRAVDGINIGPMAWVWVGLLVILGIPMSFLLIGLPMLWLAAQVAIVQSQAPTNAELDQWLTEESQAFEAERAKGEPSLAEVKGAIAQLSREAEIRFGIYEKLPAPPIEGELVREIDFDSPPEVVERYREQQVVINEWKQAQERKAQRQTAAAGVSA